MARKTWLKLRKEQFTVSNGGHCRNSHVEIRSHKNQSKIYTIKIHLIDMIICQILKILLDCCLCSNIRANFKIIKIKVMLVISFHADEISRRFTQLVILGEMWSHFRCCLELGAFSNLPHASDAWVFAREQLQCLLLRASLIGRIIWRQQMTWLEK